MKTALLIAGLFFLRVNGKGQLNTIEKIRAQYTKTNAAIAEAVKQKNTLFCNEVSVNKTGAVWANVGAYQKTTTFWYSFEDQEDEEPVERLEKVTAKTVSASDKSAEEYLFYKGELVFYYYTTWYKTEKGPRQDEHRIYFNQGKLLKHDTVKGNMEIQPETKKAIEDDALKNAKKIEQLFKTSNECEDDPAAG